LCGRVGRLRNMSLQLHDHRCHHPQTSEQVAGSVFARTSNSSARQVDTPCEPTQVQGLTFTGCRTSAGGFWGGGDQYRRRQEEWGLESTLAAAQVKRNRRGIRREPMRMVHNTQSCCVDGRNSSDIIVRRIRGSRIQTGSQREPPYLHVMKAHRVG